MELHYKNILGGGTDQEMTLLDELAREAPLNRYLEIGSFIGHSASVIGQVAKDRNGTLICIDAFLENQKYWGAEGDVITSTFDSFWLNMNKAKLIDNIVTLSGYSCTYLPKMRGKFGLIYIDGGHTIASVLPDSISCWGKLKPGGILAWHDYGNEKWQDVKTVVDCLMSKWDLKPYKQAGYILAIRKEK